MPCYNAAAYISDAISSVLVQTFTAFELLIVNDGSVDDTTEIVRSFTDQRIVLIEQEQQGVAAALNCGLLHARGMYIARFDADDICSPNRLEKQYQFMCSNPEYMIVGSAADYIDDSGNHIFTHTPLATTSEEIQQLDYAICPFIHTSVLYKKDVIAAIGYNVHAHSFEDHFLWLQLRPRGKMYNLHETLLKVRLNPGSLTMDERKRPKAFHRIKSKALQTEQINEEDGKKLLAIIRRQNNPGKKKGAYYSLLAKKFLWNNYNPPKARHYVKKAIVLNSFDIKDYLLFFISYLPESLIAKLYSTFVSAK